MASSSDLAFGEVVARVDRDLRRQEIATHVLAALIASNRQWRFTQEEFPARAVEIADRLIAELAK